MKVKIMNDEQIERFLRKAPRPTAPAGLLGELQSNIALPRGSGSASVNQSETRPFVRRWLPAISFAAIFLSCILAIGVQTSQIVGLQRENESLRAATQDLEKLRLQNAEYQKLAAAHEELQALQ